MTDELWPGGPRFRRGRGFSLGTDAVLLSSFAGTAGVKRVCDLGTGAGIIALLIAYNNPDLSVDAVEIDGPSAEAAEENAVINGLSDRMNVICGDLREYRSLLPAGAYDLVVSNPPYFKAGSGIPASGDAAARARDERTCSMSDLCAAAAYLTRWGGRFAVVHRPERLSELMCSMTAVGLEPKRMRFVQYSAVSAPNLVLLEARRGGNPSLSIEPPLILTCPDGSDTEEIKDIYHRR